MPGYASFIVNTLPPRCSVFNYPSTGAMGITLLEIESKQLKKFSQWNTTPAYAAIAFLGHLDLDLISPGYEVGHSHWVSGNPELWQLDVACDLVRGRGLHYIWPDYWCPILESSGLASNRLEHVETCYERARWCLVLAPRSLYQHLHNAPSSIESSKAAMPQPSWIIFQGNSDSHYFNGEELLYRTLERDQIMCKASVFQRLDTLGKHHRQQWAIPCPPHPEYVVVGGDCCTCGLQDRSVLYLMGLHGQNETSCVFQSQIRKSFTEGSGDSKQHKGYRLYTSTTRETRFQHSPTPQAEDWLQTILRAEQQTEAKASLPIITHGAAMNATSSPPSEYQYQSSQDGKFSNIRSWLYSTRVDHNAEEGNGLSELLPTLVPVDAGNNGMEDIEDRCSETTSQTEYQWQYLDEWARLAPLLKSSHPLSFVRGKLVHAALSKYLDQRKRQQRSSGQPIQASVSSKNQRRLEIACPFYKVDPLKHSGCLKGARLLSISQVKDHLLQQHRMPFYCPVCKSDFQTAASRDRHIVKRVCSFKEGFPYEGVSDDQRRLLLSRRKRMGLKQHWHKICALLQIKISGSASPYLVDTNIVANEVMGFRDFWRKYGQSCVADFLVTVNLNQWNRRKEEQDLASLYADILEGVSETLIRWHNTDLLVGRTSKQQ
ncbi:hypothetical protein LY76DRAFT_48005 [Colletotrichum caudatum]|nr:hypothetical protein LY76DRAFT_48005 [Colletotrichum caudatum]